MSEEIIFNGQDEPSRGADDHSELLSTLDSHDLAKALDVSAVDDEEASDFDPTAEPSETFPQPVASGGPTPTGVILWTRVAPEVFDPTIPLLVQVAEDERFDDVVYEGICRDEPQIRAHDYTVKIDLDGHLAPNHEYYYRFVYDRVVSRTGRCQTLPGPDDSPDSLRFAVLTCQNYSNGYYPAFHYVAKEDIDFLIHVGDSIYESGDGHFTGPGTDEYEGRDISLPNGHECVWGLEDYRYLYRTYRKDEFFQEALESHTLIPSWDDHEFVNNIYWDSKTDAPGGEHPRDDNPDFMTDLVADAMHAW